MYTLWHASDVTFNLRALAYRRHLQCHVGDTSHCERHEIWLAVPGDVDLWVDNDDRSFLLDLPVRCAFWLVLQGYTPIN